MVCTVFQKKIWLLKELFPFKSRTCMDTSSDIITPPGIMFGSKLTSVLWLWLSPFVIYIFPLEKGNIDHRRKTQNDKIS